MLLPIYEFSISNVDATATSLLRRDIALGGEIELAQQAADLKRVPTKKNDQGRRKGWHCWRGKEQCWICEATRTKVFERDQGEGRVWSGLVTFSFQGGIQGT